MNLFDIVQRKDRCVVVEAGETRGIQTKVAPQYRGIFLAGGTRLRLKDAQEYTALRTYPRVLNWSLHAPDGRGQSLRIWLDGRNARKHLLFETKSPNHGDEQITLDWPAWAGIAGGFDLVIEHDGEAPVHLATTWVFNPRLNLRQLIRGDGIEVGPGINPFLKNEGDIRVRYVEAASIEQWAANYGKQAPDDSYKALWDQYIIGDAQSLDTIPDGTLDFIFSSHVFEHLMNPLGVLENWRRKLKPNGVVAAVTPDLRYCFDLRQPPSTLGEWVAEYETAQWSPPRRKYERWCQFTAPSATPDSLIKRNYSIHCHYYTSETITNLIDEVLRRGWFSDYFINAAPNNKDFGFALTMRNDGLG